MTDQQIQQGIAEIFGYKSFEEMNTAERSVVDAVLYLRDNTIEQRFKESIDRYVEDRRPTGGFLRAVLENDLVKAVGRADTGALWNLKSIVNYIYNEIPGDCWGDKSKVKKWLRE